MKPDTTRRAEIETRIQALEARISGISEELLAHDAKDWEEMATEREGDEVLEDLGQAAQEELRALHAAIARMDDGEYGFCVTCGGRIAEPRLDILPATPFCAEHAAKH